MTPFMPTVSLSPDALVRIEGGEVVTWAECERRLLAARTPAPEGEAACVIAFREGRREPEFISWNKMPVGEHRLYTALRPTDTGWRDIATAPRDGSKVLLADAEATPTVLIALWNGVAWDDGDYLLDGFTHWMPLPPALTDTGREG